MPDRSCPSPRVLESSRTSATPLGGRFKRTSTRSVEPESYLEWLNFYDGFGKSRCADRGTLASTSPGSRVIYICPPQFMEKQRRDPGVAAALIIHEELHSLGLTENPPTSQAITAQVVARCGR